MIYEAIYKTIRFHSKCMNKLIVLAVSSQRNVCLHIYDISISKAAFKEAYE